MKPSNAAPTAPLYSELPYPGHGVVRKTSCKVLREGLRRHAPELLARKGLRIADIGCGTGEKTAGIACTFPEAEMVAVDINPRSLEMAKKLAERKRLGIAFVQCNISDDLLGGLQRAGAASAERLFDVVVSDGVLHHLDDPAKGLAEVRRIIRPDGLFLCFMYSSWGRREDIAVKTLLNQACPPGSDFGGRADAVRLLGLSNPHTVMENIRRLRWRLKHGTPLRPLEILRVSLKRNPLVSTSDTLSNPCEHLYEFGELRRLVEGQGWSFEALGKHGGLPTTPEEHTKNPRALALLRAMPSDALYDYFAYFYEAGGFYLILRPV